MWAKEFLKTYLHFLLQFYVYLWNIKQKNSFKKILLVRKWYQNEAHPLNRENITPPKHWHVGCLSRGNGLECWCCALRFYLGELTWRSCPKSALWHFSFWGQFSRYAHPNWNLSAQRLHSRPLPLDRHPTCLCLGNVKCSLLNWWAQFWGQLPTSKNSLKPFVWLNISLVYIKWQQKIKVGF